MCFIPMRAGDCRGQHQSILCTACRPLHDWLPHGTGSRKFTEKQAMDFLSDLLDVIPAMETMIVQEQMIKGVVPTSSRADAFFIGRGLDYAFSQRVP